MRRMETSDNEEILQLLVSSDGLHIYFITEYMVSCINNSMTVYKLLLQKEIHPLCHMLIDMWSISSMHLSLVNIFNLKIDSIT